MNSQKVYQVDPGSIMSIMLFLLDENDIPHPIVIGNEESKN